MKFDLYFTPYAKINFRRTVQQNVKGKTIKLLEDNIERLSPIGKQARNLNEHFTKQGIQIAKKHEEVLNFTSHRGSAN